MGIERGILHHNVFGHPDTERRKVPYRFDTSSHHFIGNFLSDGNRNSQYSDIHPIRPHTCFELISMINRNPINASP